MIGRWPRLKERSFEFHRRDFDDRLFGEIRIRRRRFLALFRFLGLSFDEARAVVVLVGDARKQPGIFRVMPRQRKILYAPGEFQHLRAGFHVGHHQCFLRRLHVRPHADRDAHAWQPGPLWHLGRGMHAQTEGAFARELIKLRQILRPGHHRVAGHPFHAANGRAFLNTRLHHFGRVAFHNHLTQRRAVDGQVIFQLLSGHPEGKAIVFETIRRRWFRWEVFGEIQFHAQQIAQRVGVLITREPPHHPLPARAAARLRSGLQALGQPPGQGRLFHSGQLRFILRRHVALIQLIQRIVPALGGLAAVEVEVQRVQPQLALLLLRSMTAIAVLLQDRPDVLGKHLIRLRPRRERAQYQNGNPSIHGKQSTTRRPLCRCNSTIAATARALP